MISTTENVAGAPAVTLGDVEKRAQAHRAALDAMTEELNALREELEATKKRRIKTIKQFAARAALTKAELQAMIEQGAPLFKKPKTLTMHGIKVGYRWSEGKIVIEDPEATLKLIHRHHKDREELLIKTIEQVKKDGLKTLTAVELSRIGVKIEGAGEQVVLSAVDDEVEKLVGKLIEDMVDVILEEEREAA